MAETSNHNREKAVSPGIHSEGTEDFGREESGSSRETASRSVDIVCQSQTSYYVFLLPTSTSLRN